MHIFRARASMINKPGRVVYEHRTSRVNLLSLHSDEKRSRLSGELDTKCCLRRETWSHFEIVIPQPTVNGVIVQYLRAAIRFSVSQLHT